MKKSKIVGSIIGVSLFALLIAGLTYAWITWNSDNIEISGTSDCFEVNYTVSQEIGSINNGDNVYEKLIFTDDYTEGKYAEVTLSSSNSCPNINGTGKIYLNTNSASTDNVMLGGGLYYTLVLVNNLDQVSETESVIASAPINSSEVITLADNISLTKNSSYTYRVYVWINGDIADNSYVDGNYSGYISAEAISN